MDKQSISTLHTFCFEHFKKMWLTEHLTIKSRIVQQAANRHRLQFFIHVMVIK